MLIDYIRTLCVMTGPLRHVSIILMLLLTVSCSGPKSTTEQTISDTTQQSGSPTSAPADIQETETLTDAVLNGHSVKFCELSFHEFDSLKNLSKQTEITLKPADSYFKKIDSCFVVKLQNQKVDSLCNWDDGEQFEKYSIKGLW